MYNKTKNTQRKRVSYTSTFLFIQGEAGYAAIRIFGDLIRVVY